MSGDLSTVDEQIWGGGDVVRRNKSLVTTGNFIIEKVNT